MTILNVDARSPETLRRHEDRYSAVDAPLDQLVRVDDPAFYVDPWPVYDRLRREAPAYYYEPFNTWVLTRHEDVTRAGRDHETFSAEHGILLYDGLNGRNALAELFAGDGDMIGLTDPPRHNELRRIMQPPFTPPSLAALQQRIEGFCDQLLDAIEPGVPVDWTAQVATPLPTMIIAEILGIHDSEEFFRRVRIWGDATERLSSQDLPAEEFDAVVEEFKTLTEYIGTIFEEKRAHPGDDFLTSLLRDHLDNEALSEANRVAFAQLLIAAGNDTTRSLISEMAAHLAMFPDSTRAVREDRSLVANTVEEVLRFAPAAHGFARQVVRDTEIAGTELRAGERVWLTYEAANRDPAVFDRPDEFDIRRPTNRRHVTFGFGAHTCIAAPLVRLEARILLERMLDRFENFEIADGGQRAESALRNGWVHLPMVFELA